MGVHFFLLSFLPMLDALRSLVQGLPPVQVAALGIASLAALYFTRRFVRRTVLGRAAGVDIKGSVAVVTGASAGIGAAVCKEFAMQGCKRVLMLARRKDVLEQVSSNLHAELPETEFIPVPVDCAHGDAVRAAIARCETMLQNERVILINNAGAGQWRYVHEMSTKEIDVCIAAPLQASLHVTGAVLPSMLRSSRPGCVLFVNSPAGITAWASATAYTAARWGVSGMFKALAEDLRWTKIAARHIVLGETSSEYFKVNAGSHDRMPKISKIFPTITPESAATAIANGVKGEDMELFYPLLHHILAVCNYYLPTIVSWSVALTSPVSPVGKN